MATMLIKIGRSQQNFNILTDYIWWPKIISHFENKKKCLVPLRKFPLFAKKQEGSKHFFCFQNVKLQSTLNIRQPLKPEKACPIPRINSQTFILAGAKF
jgi:hypothetical protein